MAGALHRWIDGFGLARRTLVSDNNSFDAMWLNCFTDEQLRRVLFGHSSRRIGDFYAGSRGKWNDQSSWKGMRVPGTPTIRSMTLTETPKPCGPCWAFRSLASPKLRTREKTRAVGAVGNTLPRHGKVARSDPAGTTLHGRTRFTAAGVHASDPIPVSPPVSANAE